MDSRKDDLSWLGTVMDRIYIRLLDVHAGRASVCTEDFTLIESPACPAAAGASEAL
ncbi:MAG: hypothetical protein MJ061_04400 [Mailhella sp.]|nr:hypothetical protein [Mailhella sp.]